MKEKDIYNKNSSTIDLKSLDSSLDDSLVDISGTVTKKYEKEGTSKQYEFGKINHSDSDLESNDGLFKLKRLETEQSIVISGSSESEFEEAEEEAEEEEEEEEEEVDNNGSKYPPTDQGYAWVVVISVFLVMFTTWGCNSAFGVFLSYYLSNNTFSGATKYDYAIIAGFPVALCQLLTPVTVFSMKVIGIKPTMSIGCVIMLLGFLWASFAKHLWELYVTQGVLVGISMALVSVPPATCVPPWFIKKRAVSMGISLLGTGVGGVVYGPICRKMIAEFGDTRWCYRMLAISCTVLSVIGLVLVKERIPRRITGIHDREAIKKEFSKVFDPGMVKQINIVLISLWYNISLFAYSLMVYTLASYAVARGLSQDQGAILTTILNAAQVVGRPSMGLIGDRWGRRNITCILTIILAILMFAFWLPATTFVQLIFFAILVGFCVGVANVMNIVLVADTVPPEDFQAAWGFVVAAGFGPILCCEVIAQALIRESDKHNPYYHTQIFTGCLFIAASLLSLVIREFSIRLKLQAKTKQEHGVDDKFDIVKRQHLLQSNVKTYFQRMFLPYKA